MLIGGLWKVGQPACDSSPVRHLIMPVNSTRRGSKAVPEGESDSPQPPVSVCPLQVRKRDFAIKQIRDAAIDLFVEKGFDETTIDDIAQAAGISNRSFFRYFSSKSDLMGYGVLTYGAALTDVIGSCPKTYTPAQVVRQTVLKLAHLSAMYPRLRALLQITSKYPAARAAEFSCMAAVQKQVTDAFARRFRGRSVGSLPQGFLR